MEMIIVKFNQIEEYDKKLHCGFLECTDLEFITKDHGMISGEPCVLITFTGKLEKTGEIIRVQTTTSINALHMAMSAIEGRYQFLTGKKVGEKE